MKKFMSLLKAMMSQDMNIFRYKTKANSTKTNRIMLPLFITIVVMFSIGVYYQILAEELSKINLTYIILTLAFVVATIITLIEAIYKSQGILFEARDNDMLLALPINQKSIILARIAKMYSFQFLMNALFIIPALYIYLQYESLEIEFIISSILMLILEPIIPTIVGCFIGYLIMKISSKFKIKKTLQIVFTFVAFLALMGAIFTMQNWMPNIIKNAENINETITKIYYPIGAYIKLIKDFNIKTLMILLLVNIIPLVLFVLILSNNYFNLISKSKESKRNEKKEKNITYKQKGVLQALVTKEAKRYFSSTIYVFNTFFGMVLLLIATIAMSINFEGIIAQITQNNIPIEIVNRIIGSVPKIFFGLIVILSFMTSITSSSISIEGKTFNISKTIPVKTEKILLSKILTSNLICIPVILICDIIFFLSFKIEIFDIVSILAISIIAPTVSALVGLLINLKYPKMNATSDTEVVKQSMSAAISVFLGMFAGGVVMLLLILTAIGKLNLELNQMLLIEESILFLTMIILWNFVKIYGRKRYLEIEV